jgi:peptide/nickel transport system substrate-binding protein
VRSYTLEPFQDTYATVPSIERLTFKFYQDAEMAMDALSNKHVEGVGIVPLSKARSIEENKQMTLLPLDLPQEVVLFFNQQTVDGFSKQEVREAIAASINRDALVDLLNGWAVPIHGPLLPGMIGFDETARATYDVAMVQKTIATLKDNISETSDQKKTDQQKEDETTENENETSDEQNPGELSLTTVDSEEYVAVAQALKIQLEEAGFKIELNAVPQSLFLKEVIEPRNFELLLAPVLLGQDPDPYVFWHSSQIGPNGLNLALYQNKDVDVLLEKARETTSTKERGDLYRQFAEHLLKDTPAVFLYQSKYLYALPKKIQGVTLTRINTPKDRFLDLPNWYIKTKKTLR